MFHRMALIVSTSAAAMLPAAAQEAGSRPPGSLLSAQVALLILGVALTGYAAYGAFETSRATLGDDPTPPRYMTQPRQYRLGLLAYVAISLLVYILIVYFHKQLLPLVPIVAPPGLAEIIANAAKNDSISFPLVVIFSAAVVFVLLKTDAEWNPLCLLRRLVWGWVSIPHLANSIMVTAREQLVVPLEWRTRVVETADVDIGDFVKERQSLDRRWAEVSYIRLWLTQNREHGSHFTFFNEPSFAWDNLEADYERTRGLIAPLKLAITRDQGRDANLFGDVAGKVETLRRRYCRLAACFIVFKNETKKGALRDAEQFGAPVIVDPSRANPVRYAVIFLVAIALAIYLGVWLSAMGWDMVRGSSHSIFTQDPDLVTRWTIYGVANYGMPILAVLLLRYLGWTNDPDQPSSYVISYATIFLLASGVSIVCLAVAIKLVGSTQAAMQPFFDLVVGNFKWCFPPALVAVYVAYHVDRQIDPLLPDLDSLGARWRLPQGLASCVLFGAFMTIFAVMPTMSIVVPPDSAWEPGKLHAVVLGTTFVIGVVMALAGEFCLVKPKPAAGPKLQQTA